MFPSPARERDLANIQVASRVDGDAVRSQEWIVRRPELRIVDASNQRTVMSKHAEPWPDVRSILVDSHPRTEFANVTHRTLAAGHT
jgi:hypothetical protein